MGHKSRKTVRISPQLRRGCGVPACIRKWLWSQKEPEPFIYLMERATGIEPASSAWKAGVLPLNYARKIWSGRQDLNLRHPAPKAGALPNCATARCVGSGRHRSRHNESVYRTRRPCRPHNTQHGVAARSTKRTATRLRPRRHKS